MKPLSLQTPCPCCSQSMDPSALHCFQCGVTVTGAVEANEFASLSEEDLHLLRIFVWAEGRIRDMEAPLGLSYPTIRTRLARLKDGLRLAPGSASAAASTSTAAAAQAAKPTSESPDAVLDALDSGAIDFETALQKIKKGKK